MKIKRLQSRITSRKQKDNELSIYSFDTEVSDIDTMYTDFLNHISTLTNNELKIEVMKEDISNVNYEEGTGIQVIEFEILGKNINLKLK